MSTVRPLALALCTLWGNILLLDVPGSVLLSAPFASRMASMAFSIVGFAAAWLVARSCGRRPMRSRSALLAVCAVLSSVGSLLHFSGFAWLPGWIDVASAALFSVAFAFLLVACGEVYAVMGARRAVVCAAVSYMLAYLGSTLVAGLGPHAVCVVETLLPLAVLALVVQGGAAHEGGGAVVTPNGVRTERDAWERGEAPVGAPSGVRAKAVACGHGGELCPAMSVRSALAATLEAIPACVLAAIGITYFAIGSTLSQAGTPLDYFTWGTALAAVLTSMAVMAVTILLHGRVSLTGLYKALMVGQVLAAFLLSEWSEGAQIAIVITFVGVKVVAWTLMAELALLAHARGTAPAALVYAAGCLAGHIGEGVAGVLSVFGLVDQGPLTIVVVGLLVGAAAFLFTGEMGKYPDISDGTARGGVMKRDGRSPSCDTPGCVDAARSVAPAATPPSDSLPQSSVPAQASLDARISELARAYLLSARETDVFRLWATGHTLKYIQEKLYLSPSTVKTHVRHIYEKTGKHSRAEIVELLDPLADRG